MIFSVATLREAWTLARGRCECTRDGHGHAARCEQALEWERLGFLGKGGWQPSPWVALEAGGEDDAENCEILCWRCSPATSTPTPLL